MPIETLRCPKAIAALGGPPSASRLTETTVRLQSPTRHFVLLANDGTCRARCSVWTDGAPTYAGQAVARIGHYAAADPRAAQRVLAHAMDHLRKAGSTFVVGPMDGSTWFSYRFVTGERSTPPFFMEPWHPPAYPVDVEDAGFTPIEQYVSARVPASDPSPPDAPPVPVNVRGLDTAHLDADLRRVHALATTCFAGNVLYSPLDPDAFLALYRPLVTALNPSLFRLAETPDGRLVGMILLVPDRCQAERGGPVDTVITKTVAVHPERVGQGLGHWLYTEAQHVAHRLGYIRSIHALMHTANRSLRMSRARSSIPMRRYTLFGRAL